jgi:hypothetical protein
VARVAVPARLLPWTLSISPDGRTLLVGDDQGGIHILRTPAEEPGVSATALDPSR